MSDPYKSNILEMADKITRGASTTDTDDGKFVEVQGLSFHQLIEDYVVRRKYVAEYESIMYHVVKHLFNNEMVDELKEEDLQATIGCLSEIFEELLGGQHRFSGYLTHTLQDKEEHYSKVTLDIQIVDNDIMDFYLAAWARNPSTMKFECVFHEHLFTADAADYGSFFE